MVQVSKVPPDFKPCTKNVSFEEIIIERQMMCNSFHILQLVLLLNQLLRFYGK